MRPDRTGRESTVQHTLRGSRAYMTQSGSLFTVGQTVGQPARTVANISDLAHAPDATLIRTPRQMFCPDTEEVTGSNPVSPTSITPGQAGFVTTSTAALLPCRRPC
jgi:hypothetical protein